MKSAAIFALSTAWFSVSPAVAAPKSPDHLDYLNGLAMIKVESGDALQQAIAAIPIKANLSITPQQQADLHDWLYDFLVAFSASGNDSLAAAFYLRGGINLAGIVEIKRQLAAIKRGGTATAYQLRAQGIQTPELPVEPTPFALFKAMHRLGLNRRDYFFGNVSFFTSAYKVFELQGDYYESYRDYARTHNLLHGYAEWSPALRGRIEEGLKLGGQWVAAEFMFTFSAEEPAQPDPFFVRLIWHPRQAMWRLVEAFAPNDAPVLFLFNST